MSIAENKLLLRRYITDVWDNADVDAIRRYAGPAFRRHLSPVLPPLGLEEQVERIAGFREAFPDVTLTLEEVTAEDDRVAFLSTMRGTHLGEFAGIPPTGKHVTVGLVDVIRFEDGRFVEQWGGPDLFDLLRQLGATYSAAE